MDRVTTYAALDEVASADLNAIQDNALGIAQVTGRWVTRPTLRSTGNGDVVVGATAGLILGTSTVLPAKGETTVSGGTLSVNAWHYVYAYNSSGAIAYEVSTTVPDSHLRHKAGDTTRAYVGCARSANSTSAFMPFVMHGGRYVYQLSALASWPARWGNGTDTGAWVDQSLAYGVPPTSRLADLHLFASNSQTGYIVAIGLRTTGDTADSRILSARAVASGTVLEVEVTLPWVLTSSQHVEYRVYNSGSDGANEDAWVEVVGFTEPLP